MLLTTTDLKSVPNFPIMLRNVPILNTLKTNSGVHLMQPYPGIVY